MITKDVVLGGGRGDIKIFQNLNRLASGSQNMEFWVKIFLAPISAYYYATFEPNLYLWWSVPKVMSNEDRIQTN